MKKKNDTGRTKTTLNHVVLLVAALLSPMTATGADVKLTPALARNLAKDAWLFGLPLVMFEKQFEYGTYAVKPEETRAPVNQFVHYRKFVDASNRTVVGFNVDNLYSFAGLDLAPEPLVLSVPKMGDRYWLMQIVDAWNGVPAAPGSRTHGGAKAQDFLIAGPNWKGTAPDGIEVLRSPTNLIMIGGRTYCAGANDYAAVNALQDQYKLTPLSAWGKPYTPPANVPLKEGVDGETLVNAQVMALTAQQFFSNLNRLLATNPPNAEDAPTLEKLRPLGIVPGAPFSTEGLDADVVAAIEEGVPEGKAAMGAEMKNLGKMVNYWGLTYDMGRYGTKYAYRAAWTFVGIGGNVIEDAFYPLALNDADGKQLTGEHKYTLTFKKGAWPPAEAFWSMTLYDMEGYLVDNPLDRYAIGDRSGMEPNPDGSLTIYIQSESPGKDKESNWLPAPKSGPFKLAMRLYVPRESVRNGDWVPAAVERIGTGAGSTAATDIEAQVQEYLRLFPYQETYRYAMLQTGEDPAKLNTWVDTPRGLLKAGEDKVVRSNNDTLYKMAWVYLGDGPVVLQSAAPSKERFSSFQLQDDRNANYRNIIYPEGSYTLYYGEKPANIVGEAVEVPSLLSAVILRIEVKDKSDADDMAAALAVFDGMTIEGPAIGQLPVVDVLSAFDEQVVQEAEKRIQETKKTVPYRDMIAAPGQEPGKDVSFLNFATGTKEGWGGPATSHSAYESMYNDASGETLDGSKGEYTLTTEAPPVKAFWSVTIYDSTTGRFHPNDDNRYHINNTTAFKNEDGSYTFRFKVKCEDGDVNCLEVPAGPFDVAIRYYLPGPEIMSGEWTMPRPVLKKATAATADAPLTPAEAKAIAKEVFLWGMHPVALYHLRYNFAQNEKSPRYVGINRLSWDRTPMKALPRIATTPNATTLYGVGFLDLSKEPAVVTVAEVKDRYWSVQFHDNYARWWHMIGSQFNAPGPVRRLLIGPNWSGDLPDGFVGADIVRSPSDFAGVLARVALTDDTLEDLALVNGIQDRFTVVSLSAWVAAGRKDVKAEDVPMTKGAYPTYAGMEAVREPGKLGGVDFLRWVSLVLNDPSFTKQTDGHKEITALARFERLGLKAGSPFDPTKLAPEIVAAIEEGIEEGKKDVLALSAEGAGVERNGWDFSSDLDYRDTDWRQRARYGLIAVLAPVPSRSHVGTFCMKDSEGRPLSGEHRYTITFDLDDMPPVTEFWEMPLYDNEGYFYDNPLDRYSLNSYMLERGKLHTADGKLVIYVQHEEPKNPKQRQNWLPAPKDSFRFTARFYGPYTPLIDGSYNMPGVMRVD